MKKKRKPAPLVRRLRVTRRKGQVVMKLVKAKQISSPKLLRKLKIKYKTDKKFREHAKKYYREKYHRVKAYHNDTLERARRRYYEDLLYRRATIARSILQSKRRLRQLRKAKQANKQTASRKKQK